MRTPPIQYHSISPLLVPALDKSHIIAIDPGETTAIAEFKDGDLLDVGTWTFESMIRLAGGLLSEQSVFRVPIMVVESWRLYPKMAGTMVGSEFKPVQVIGMLRALSHQAGSRIVFQGAANVKRFVTDERLAVYGLDKHLLSNDHKRDAVRHGIYFLSQQQRVERQIRGVRR